AAAVPEDVKISLWTGRTLSRRRDAPRLFAALSDAAGGRKSEPSCGEAVVVSQITNRSWVPCFRGRFAKSSAKVYHRESMLALQTAHAFAVILQLFLVCKRSAKAWAWAALETQ